MNRQRKIFYGWWVFIALFLIGMLAPMGRYCMAAFFPFISSELGWSRSIIGSAQTLTFWVYAVFVLLSGWMTDRIGGRKTIFLGGFLCFGGWILLSTVESLWQLYLYYGLIMGVAVSMSHYVPIQATARKWFSKRAGLVAGTTTAAFAVGSSIFTPLLTEMSDSFGWRTTSVISAFAFGIAVMLLAFFVIRDTPESMGLRPDGESPTPASNGDRMVVEKAWTIKEAVKTPQLWFLFVVYSVIGIPIQGLLAHLVMWGVDLGSTRATAGIFVTAMTMPSIAARIGGGWLGDRYGKRKIMIISYVCCVLLLLWAWQGVSTAQHLITFAILFGFGYGIPVGLFSPYLGDLFGRANIGALFGIITMGYGFVGGSGAVIWGAIFDTSGSYGLACLVSAVCYAIAVIAIFLVRPAKRRLT